jgi:hypothetical protein
MSNRTPVGDAFVFLAGKLSRAVRHKERIAVQAAGGELYEDALSEVQKIEQEASECFSLVKRPEGMRP